MQVKRLQATAKGLSPAEIGLILGSFSASQLIFYPVIGFLASRVSARKRVVFSLALSLVRSLVLSQVPDCSSSECMFWWTMAMQLSEGLAAALSMTAIMSHLMLSFPDQATRYQVRTCPEFNRESIVVFIQSTVDSVASGGAIGGPVVSGLAYKAWGFRGPFLVTATAYAVALGGAFVIFNTRHETQVEEDITTPIGSPISVFRHLLSSRGVRLALWIQFLENLNLSFVYGSISLFVTQV